MAEKGVMSFEYQRPADWAEAARLLAEPGAVAKMGGCDVLTRFRSGRLRARLVVGLNDLPGVDELSIGPEGARIGAAVTLARLEHSAAFATGWPIIAQVIHLIASPAIRTTATVVGNVAQGWSVGDLVPLFEICDAEIEIRSNAKRRRLAVSEYAKTEGSTALKSGEAIEALILKPLQPDRRMAYERFTLKEAFDLPLVSVAVAASNHKEEGYRNFRVAAVGGSPLPARCQPAEVALEGSTLGANDIDEALAAIGRWAEPVSDFRASSAYRRHLLVTMLRRALQKLAAAKER
jgi:CO/xanthine dehydrogenase FAD-binding subunit